MQEAQSAADTYHLRRCRLPPQRHFATGDFVDVLSTQTVDVDRDVGRIVGASPECQHQPGRQRGEARGGRHGDHIGCAGNRVDAADVGIEFRDLGQNFAKAVVGR